MILLVWFFVLNTIVVISVCFIVMLMFMFILIFMLILVIIIVVIISSRMSMSMVVITFHSLLITVSALESYLSLLHMRSTFSSLPIHNGQWFQNVWLIQILRKHLLILTQPCFLHSTPYDDPSPHVLICLSVSNLKLLNYIYSTRQVTPHAT